MSTSASHLKSRLAILASLELTVGLLVLSVFFVFAATLDQVHLGVWGVQEKYFHAFFVMANVPGTQARVPVFPGGYLLGGALLANLLAAHFLRFKLTWRKTGIWLTHAGFILLIVGEGVSGLLQRDEQMRIDVGQTRRYAENVRDYELAIVDATHPAFDDVVAVPSALLRGPAPIQHPKLPFVVVPKGYFANAMVRMKSPAEGAGTADQGAGASVALTPMAVSTKPDEANWPAAYVELRGPEGPLGTWLVSAVFAEPQSFSYGGRTWQLALRPARDYLPFSLTLERFTHDVYPGTDIPKNFASTVRIREDGAAGQGRRVVISMNNPLRFAGRAFYQAGYDNNDRTTVLQVVRNPGWTLPYAACGLMGAGLAVQFCMHLFAFFRRRAVGGPGGERGAVPQGALS